MCRFRADRVLPEGHGQGRVASACGNPLPVPVPPNPEHAASDAAWPSSGPNEAFLLLSVPSSSSVCPE